MYSTLYQKPDVELPYNIDTRYSKSVQEGTTKEKYEQRWVVLTEQVNDFITTLPTSYNNLALVDVTREDRGPLTILTANYGDSGLLESYTGDGEISWWTFGGSVYSYHIRRWVANNPAAIKDFCTHCVRNYGYQSDEVTVNCNPIAGEPRVMCEATFTPDIETNEEQDPTTSPGWSEITEEDEEPQESGESVQVAGTMDSLTPPAPIYVAHKLGVTVDQAREIISIINQVERGEITYKRKGDYGESITTNGWYSTDETNPNALKSPIYQDSGHTSKNNVDSAEVYLQNISDVLVPAFKVTVTTTVKAKHKMTLQKAVSNSSIGAYSKTIKAGTSTIQAPSGLQGRDGNGTAYTMSDSEWLDEGVSFDLSSTRKRSSLTTGQTYYEGTQSHSYRLISYLTDCNDSSSTQSI